jgi:hypothetical protein
VPGIRHRRVYFTAMHLPLKRGKIGPCRAVDFGSGGRFTLWHNSCFRVLGAAAKAMNSNDLEVAVVRWHGVGVPNRLAEMV